MSLSLGLCTAELLKTETETGIAYHSFICLGSFILPHVTVFRTQPWVPTIDEYV